MPPASSSIAPVYLALTVVGYLVAGVPRSWRPWRPGTWRFVVLTPLFGLGGTVPLFLWFRERALGTSNAPTKG